MKITTVIGARPQFIKAAMVSKHLREKHEETLIHTGQHFDHNMSRIFFEELDLPKPDVNLEIREINNTLQVAKMMMKISSGFERERPDMILVYGDTNSTLAGALAGRQHNIPVAHVEAGLRSFDMQMPEEQNRVLTDRIANQLFCPTKNAVDLLKKEGITQGVTNVGDVMYDSVLTFKDKAKYELDIKEFNLMTLHRAGNTDDPTRLKAIMDGISSSALPVVFPMHPRTKHAIERFGLAMPENVHVVEPVGYLEMLWLEQKAKMILTDSGGVQKEAYFLKVPCVTLRDQTEWVETVKDGWNVLVGADTERIKKALQEFAPSNKQTGIFGDGHAGEKIAKCVE